MKAKELYTWLSDPANLDQYEWIKRDQGDGMSVIAISIWGWWKPIFLVDDKNKTAVQFMDLSQHLLTVTEKDIVWASIPKDIDGYERAKSLDASFPTNFRGFENDIALVEWQINPDGQYYSDDGFGMTDDVEVTLSGFVGRDGRVVEPFRHIGKNWTLIDNMRARAVKKNRRKKQS